MLGVVWCELRVGQDGDREKEAKDKNTETGTHP